MSTAHRYPLGGHYTHTLVVRDPDGTIRSTTVARVVDGRVVDLAGHFATGRGTPRFHRVYEALGVAETAAGRTVELVPDGGRQHGEWLRALLPTPRWPRW